MPDERCHCGRPLHYNSDHTRRTIEEMIRINGPTVDVVSGGRRWKVPRHYIALHGLKADEIHTLGFEEIT